MPLQAVKNRSLADQVFAQLATEIIGGRYQPGSALPSERELADVFDVNRHVVREALKRLAQASMVRISQGGHTRVLDYKRHAGLELLALFAEYAPGHSQSMAHWVAVLEMRVAMASDMARLCALRATPELRKELVDISARMAATADVQEVYDLDVRFWQLVIDGAGNLAYQLAFNSLIKSAARMGAAARDLAVVEVRASGNRQPLAQAIYVGDAERAEADTRDRMRSQLGMLNQMFGHQRTREPQPAPRADTEPAKRFSRLERKPTSDEPAAP